MEDVWKSFDSGRIEVLKGISLTIRKGAVVALCGPALSYLTGATIPLDGGQANFD